MPFTPYHLGPGFLLGLLLFRWADFVAVLIGSVILDIEPFVILVTGSALPLHGLCHTYLAGSVLSILISAALWYLRAPTRRVTSIFGLYQDSGPLRTYASCLVGTVSHVFLDSFLYAEMNPFYPILGNPFYGHLANSLIYQSCLFAGLLGLLVYVILLISRATGADQGKTQKQAHNEAT